LSDEFENYAIVGGRFQWNLTPYYTRQQGREKELLSIQQQQVTSQKAALVEQLTVTQLRLMGEVDKLRRQKEITAERRQLLTQIRETAEAQHREGVITYTDLLDKITEEQSLEMLSATLDVQELLAVWRLKWATGGL
jgi:outer membrane protein TolC